MVGRLRVGRVLSERFFCLVLIKISTVLLATALRAQSVIVSFMAFTLMVLDQIVELLEVLGVHLGVLKLSLKVSGVWGVVKTRRAFALVKRLVGRSVWSGYYYGYLLKVRRLCGILLLLRLSRSALFFS